jgi:anti-anti-sigma factor
MPPDGVEDPNRDPDPAPPSIDVELRPSRAAGYAAIITLRGEHDLATSEGLAVALAQIDGNVLLDLSACEFIDSTTIGVVIGKSQDLTRAGNRLELVVPAENRILGRIVDVVGLRTLVSVHQQVPVAELKLDVGSQSPNEPATPV